MTIEPHITKQTQDMNNCTSVQTTTLQTILFDMRICMVWKHYWQLIVANTRQCLFAFLGSLIMGDLYIMLC